MGTKLFVGNLSFEVTSDELRQTFSQAGTVVDAVVLTDKVTGRSRGFGFVEMSSEEEAKMAMEKFNDFEISGRKIRVNEAKPREDR